MQRRRRPRRIEVGDVGHVHDRGESRGDRACIAQAADFRDITFLAARLAHPEVDKQRAIAVDPVHVEGARRDDGIVGIFDVVPVAKDELGARDFDGSIRDRRTRNVEFADAPKMRHDAIEQWRLRELMVMIRSLKMLRLQQHALIPVDALFLFHRADPSVGKLDGGCASGVIAVRGRQQNFAAATVEWHDLRGFQCLFLRGGELRWLGVEPSGCRDFRLSKIESQRKRLRLCHVVVAKGRVVRDGKRDFK